MKLVRALALLALCLLLQQGLGRLAPASYGLVDFLMLPVVGYAIVGSQRSAMLVGCGAGLLQDAWFSAGVFGLNGFKKTLLGWLLGAIGVRFDLNHQSGRFLAGALASLADSLLDQGLRRMLDQRIPPPQALEMLGKALFTGLLVVAAFAVVRRFSGDHRLRRRLTRRA